MTATTLGEEIRRLRLARGMTMRALAGRVGISVPFICDVEHGRRRPTPVRLAQFADSLGVPTRQLAKAAGACPHCLGSGLTKAVSA